MIIILTGTLLLLVNSSLLSLRLSAQAGSFPRPLSAAEEAEELRLAALGDLDARNRLIEHNLRLVAHIVKKYYTADGDTDDLISIGTIGLIKGISSYRPDKGVRLATYASRCIENEVLMYFRARKKSAGNVSLSETIETDGDGNSLSLMDILCDETDMLESISDREQCEELQRAVEKVLSPRERTIIDYRYGYSGAAPKTQRETAELLGISRSYVSRIEKRALDKLRAALSV